MSILSNCGVPLLLNIKEPAIILFVHASCWGEQGTSALMEHVALVTLNRSLHRLLPSAASALAMPCIPEKLQPQRRPQHGMCHDACMQRFLWTTSSLQHFYDRQERDRRGKGEGGGRRKRRKEGTSSRNEWIWLFSLLNTFKKVLKSGPAFSVNIQPGLHSW